MKLDPRIASLLTLLFLAGPQAASADAIRAAAFAALSVRRSDSVETKHSSLALSFDALRSAPPASAPKGRARLHRNWFQTKGAPAEDLRDALASMPAPPVRPASFSMKKGVDSAVRCALSPWRKLLDAAWGGSWTGSTEMRAYR